MTCRSASLSGVFVRFAVLLVLANPVFAQTVVGTAVIDGKRVDLLDDNTWRYAIPVPPPEQGCQRLNTVVEFCGAENWRTSAKPGPDFLAAYKFNDRSYGGVIYEGIGSSSGLSEEFLRKVVIRFAAAAIGKPESEVPVLELRPADVDGRAAETMVYAFQIDGLDVVYQNTMLIAENSAIQFLVWTIGDAYSETEKAVSDDFLSNIRLNLEAP